MTAGPPALWSQADRRKVEAWILAGLACSEIGARFKITRNAVIGRIHRDAELKKILSHRGYPTLRRAQGKQAAPPQPKPRTKSFPKPKPKPKPEAPMPPKSVAEILHDDWTGWEEREAFRKAKPLIKLRANQCRWPVLDAPDVPGGFLFCAEAVDNKGWPYCRHHYGRARA